MQLDLTDPQTFSTIYDEHRSGVHAVALRVLRDSVQAQDVVQDVFLRLWKNPGAFNPERGELGSFLRMVARSRALDLWREGQSAGRAGDRLKLAVESAGDQTRIDEHPGEAAERAAVRALVRERLRELPTAQREALVLAYWGGMTANEIARHTGIPLGTAKSRLRLGVTRMRADVAELAA